MAQISVIVPVHNTAPYLKRCLDSIISQTLKDIEIILVENLSTDGSGEICDLYAIDDSRIKVLHLDIMGLSVARNAGISIASAPYVAFIDSDDHILPEMLEEMWSAVSQANADIAYCNLCYEYPDGRIEDIYPNNGTVCVRTPKEVIIDNFCEVVSSSCCTKLFKKELFNHLLFPEGACYEDHQTFYKWLMMSSKIVSIDKSFYFYYQRSGSICRGTDLSKRIEYFTADYERISFIKKCNIFTQEEKSMLIKVIIKHLLWIFKTFMREPNHWMYKDIIIEMRRKFQVILSFPKNEIDSKSYKKIFKISHFWFIYYTVHFLKYKNKKL